MNAGFLYIRVAIFAVILWGCGSRAIASEQLLFGLPVICEKPSDCVVQQYFDHDPTAGYEDYMCGKLSYDGHQGTDFRTRDLVHMELGVPVVAAADGVVRAVRDGMDDVNVRKIGQQALEGRWAGNSVVITHKGGVETQYSHLRKGSVAVRAGQRVRAGERLGLVGLSGNTEFPHVEFAVRKDGKPVDPFGGMGPCAPTGRSMWNNKARAILSGYTYPWLLAAGFAGEKPTLAQVQQRMHTQEVFPADAPVFVFWTRLLGLAPGDILRVKIIDPQGFVMVFNRDVVGRNLIHKFRYVGKERHGRQWLEGCYVGSITVTRQDAQGVPRIVLRYETMADVYE